jgi:hypothetical protein
MKLWFIEQSVNTGYDTYSDAVVAADTEAEAVTIHPNGDQWNAAPKSSGWSPGCGDWGWAKTPDQVSAKLIGEAVAGTELGVICSSFHAG